MGLLGPVLAPGNSGHRHFDPEMDPKSGQTIDQTGVKIGRNFGPVFYLICGLILGAILGSKWAKRRQDDPNEGIKSPKAPRNNIYKNCNFQKTFRVLEAPKMIIRGSTRLPRDS